MGKFVVWDIETTTMTHMKRKANPFLEANFVVAQGWQRSGGEVVGEYYGTGKKPFDWFTKLLVDTKFLVVFNGKFDLLYALREPQNLEAWMEFVANGGLVWDCQLAEYLLSGQEPNDMMLSLDQTAPRYGGTIKIDEVKALWEAGVDTIDIDEDLLMRYLVGGEHNGEHFDGDITNTLRIYQGQVKRAQEQKQIRSILMNMGALICTVEMERNGMKIDRELGLALAKDLEEELQKITKELVSFLPDDVPFDFNWSNRYHLSPLIFGGRVKYQKRVHQLDENGRPAYAQRTVKHVFLLHHPTTETVDDKVVKTYKTMPLHEWQGMDHQPEPVRYASGKNKGEVKTINVTEPDPDKPKLKWEDHFYQFKGYTNPRDEWKSSTEGLYSVAANVIEELGNENIPFLKTLARVAEITKDLGTYFIRQDPKSGEYTGMLTLVDGQGLIHHMLNMTSTVTARLSSSNPNLQNISKGTLNDENGKYNEQSGEVAGSQIKRVFISRFEGGSIVQDDYTSLEIYIQALLTNCKQLKIDLANGLDMHCVRVSQTFGISYEEAVRLCKKEEVPLWKKRRGNAKVFSFQRAYGAGKAKISKTTGMPEEEVQALIDAEEVRYPELSAYNREKTKRIIKSRIPTQVFCQHPEVRGLTCQLGKGYSITPDGKRYSYRESPSPAWAIREGGMPQSFSPTEIANYEVQGEGAEWIKAAMWLAVRAFYAAKNFDGLALLVNNVHDALYLDTHESKRVVAAAVLHACMLEANTFMEWYFGWKVDVPVPAECAYGKNMMQELHFGDDMKALSEKVRLALRAKYMDNYQPSFIKEAA